MDLNEMSPDQFEEWLQRTSEATNSLTCEEEMAKTLADAMRADKASEKVELFVKLANQAMQAADTTLGAQGRVTTAIGLTLH
ncbi:hypothetical protein [Noviherbaspirillum pedocola]|uniref:Uncharacterized protein n=1 Tax=Noviherbaspirillum pedocola TaxID=2801341 RepID=A0A934W756_9BURK|nr:hypothetical protein [Noviherbaspirillum pedocola]MBK4735970.1 hypothetical protein [Noviherbaspirillum pedocola]